MKQQNICEEEKLSEKENKEWFRNYEIKNKITERIEGNIYKTSEELISENFVEPKLLSQRKRGRIF
jgi:hypothetical protein